MQIAYLTDVEGQWEKLESFCAGNRWLTLEQDRLLLDDAALFVFGGDAIDRGPHSRRIVRLLSDAKRRYPERVVLLAGNRDINKLRLRRELGGHPPGQAPQFSDSAVLLRWIFEKTMGAPAAFEHRRAELATAPEARVEDIDVVNSFRGDVEPDGELTQYLRSCQLAFRAGTTLFVHGGVTPTNLGQVPSSDGFTHTPDLDQWVQRLNGWYRAQLDAYVAAAFEADGRPAWQPLIDYQAPVFGQRNNPHSVVYTRLADEHNDPRLPARAVVDHLVSRGVLRLVVGHMPAGDSPAVLRDPLRRFEVVFADNSHGRVNCGSKVYLDDQGLRIAGEVQLDDETRHALDFTLEPHAASVLGMRLGVDGPLIKAPLGTGYLTFKALSGYRIEQRFLPAEIADRALITPYD